MVKVHCAAGRINMSGGKKKAVANELNVGVVASLPQASQMTSNLY